MVPGKRSKVETAGVVGGQISNEDVSKKVLARGHGDQFKAYRRTDFPKSMCERVMPGIGSRAMELRDPRSKESYWSPYVAGLAIGLTLTLTYYVMGHGLGASGAFTQLTAKFVQLVAPDHAEANTYLSGYLKLGAFWQSWIVLEVLGVFLGGLLGALTAKRFRFQIERGLQISKGSRLLLALLGGFAVGFGSRLAQGCTSGQALSGGAVLAVGSWLFTLMFFTGGYLFAWLVRREWR